MIADYFKLFRIVVSRMETEDKHSFHTRKMLLEYENRRHEYHAFARVMHRLMEEFLIQNRYKYLLHSRVKDEKSLEEKIRLKYHAGETYKELDEIEDIVGVRIIFYTELDKTKFIKEIKEEISGFMRFEEKERKTGYSATHIITSLGPKRLQLAEYKAFDRLKCEIQITSVLQHAWSEIEHDLIYKDTKDIKRLNVEQFNQTKKKLQSILERYLVAASSEFEEVIKQMRNIDSIERKQDG